VVELEKALAGRAATDWSRLLGDRGIPCGPVNDLAEAIALAESLDLAPVVSLPSPTGDIATLASPLTLHRTPVRYPRAPPALGADNDAVRRWLEADGNAL
jgi:crotonobetainyl-CoA:carnitine CoA-transferase CaiB-like acyl-CoA transferase